MIELQQNKSQTDKDNNNKFNLNQRAKLTEKDYDVLFGLK